RVSGGGHGWFSGQGPLRAGGRGGTTPGGISFAWLIAHEHFGGGCRIKPVQSCRVFVIGRNPGAKCPPIHSAISPAWIRRSFPAAFLGCPAGHRAGSGSRRPS